MHTVTKNCVNQNCIYFVQQDFALPLARHNLHRLQTPVHGFYRNLCTYSQLRISADVDSVVKFPQMPDKIHPFKVVLTQHLVHRYCNGVGQIEGAGVGNHGDTHRLIVVVMHKLFGQALLSRPKTR